jgi:uncharacterized protein YukE
MGLIDDLLDPLALGAAAHVAVSPDPSLMSADPGSMRVVSAAYDSAAHNMYELFQTASTATGVILASWHGHAASNFYDATQQQDENAQAAADALIGAANALKVLAARIETAQDQARKGVALADTTRRSAAQLAKSTSAAAQARVAALPSAATPLDIFEAGQPTASDTLAAEALAGDAAQAVKLVDDANDQARAAWKQSQSAFDAVTAQSPSVQNALMNARINAFNQQMDNFALMFAATMVAGSLSGDTGEGDEDEEDPGIDFEDPAIQKEIEAEGLNDGDNASVDGLNLDEGIAVDGNSDIVVDDTNVEQAALGDPVGGSEIADPTLPLSAGKYPYLEPAGTDDSIDATAGKMPGFDPGHVDGAAPPGWDAPTDGALTTFQGPVSPMAATGGVTYYRVVGDGSGPDGSFWTTTPPTPSDRAGLAIKGSWNSMSGVVTFTPAGGESIPGWQGAAAPQSVTMPDGRPGYLPGGDQQIWVPRGTFNNDNGTFRVEPIGGGS